MLIVAAEPRGPALAGIDRLTWLMVALGAIALAIVLYALLRGLRGREELTGRGERIFLVGGGLILPGAMIVVVFAATLAVMRTEAATTAPDALVIEITGHQWWWDVYYPEEGIRTANEIHIPVGEVIELRLTSADVVHSFWVPSLGEKLDLLPDRVNTMTLLADEQANYRGTCAEFCGLQHAKMAFRVITHERGDFESWVSGQQETPKPPLGATESRGLEVFLTSECPDCHTIEGTGAVGRKGPDLTHVAGRDTIAAASFANTTENLRSWVAEPQTRKPGVDMPDIELGTADLDALVAYLETLD